MAAEADDDARHADEEGLDPKAHDLVVEEVAVALGLDVGGCFELDPVDWGEGIIRFRAPDLETVIFWLENANSGLGGS